MNQQTPLYKKIEEYIRDNIYTKWKPNEQLPTEAELSAQFGVSRITVRNALTCLMDEGLIYRIQGKGSFVSDSPPEPVVQPASLLDMTNKKIVAFLVPYMHTTFVGNILSGIGSELSRRGYHLLFYETDQSKEEEDRILQKLFHLGVDGIIIYPVEGEIYNEEILRLTLNHFPLVVVDRYFKGIETNCVYSDNYGGAYEAVKHLLQLGHSDIGFLSTTALGTTSIEDRILGYEGALVEQNLPIDHKLRYTHLNFQQIASLIKTGKAEEESRSEIRAFIERNPDMTAVLASSNAIGVALFEVTKEMGLRIPEDLSVIIFDDFEFSNFSSIPPTVVNQQERLMGAEAAKLLISLIESPKSERSKLIIPTKLVIRSSTTTPAYKAGR